MHGYNIAFFFLFKTTLLFFIFFFSLFSFDRSLACAPQKTVCIQTISLPTSYSDGALNSRRDAAVVAAAPQQDLTDQGGGDRSTTPARVTRSVSADFQMIQGKRVSYRDLSSDDEMLRIDEEELIAAAEVASSMTAARSRQPHVRKTAARTNANRAAKLKGTRKMTKHEDIDIDIISE